MTPGWQYWPQDEYVETFQEAEAAMGMPPSIRTVYLDWLMLGESYEAVARKYGVRRESVYKRIRRYQAKLARGCRCTTWRCTCPGTTVSTGPTGRWSKKPQKEE